MSPLDRREFLKASAGALAVAATGAGFARASGVADELAALDATAQAELVRRKQLKPIELIEAAIARIEATNSKLHAVVTPLYERARERARRPVGDGPFTGVPTLLKDLLPVEGVRITYGSVFFKDHVATHTAEVTRRMEAAGLVLVGVSSSPEFGLLPTTEPVLHGPTRNPWSLDHSPGGSSGGAAAAVAAGLVPIAQASDGGGSIRIPAAACGVFGLKPSRGRNPQWPDSDAQGLPVRHCVSRSVRDSAALLDATRGPVAGDRWWAPPPARPYAQEVRLAPGRLRIAFTTEDFTGQPVHPDCVAAVHATAKICEGLGHRVEEARPKIPGEAFDDAFLLLWSQYAAEVVKNATRMLGHPPERDRFEPFTWQLAEHDARHTPGDLAVAWTVLQQSTYTMARFLTRYEVFLTPVLGAPPVVTGGLPQDVDFETMRARLRRYVPFTPVANVTGQPAMSVPLHWNEAGLPIGSHFVGRFGDEATLLRLAAQLERAQPWAGRRPPLFAVS